MGIVPVTVNPWSTFNDVALKVGVTGAASAGFTVTADDAEDVDDSGEVALSVTT